MEITPDKALTPAQRAAVAENAAVALAGTLAGKTLKGEEVAEAVTSALKLVNESGAKASQTRFDIFDKYMQKAIKQALIKSGVNDGCRARRHVQEGGDRAPRAHRLQRVPRRAAAEGGDDGLRPRGTIDLPAEFKGWTATAFRQGCTVYVQITGTAVSAVRTFFGAHQDTYVVTADDVERGQF
jgi:hypothetical protein